MLNQFRINVFYTKNWRKKQNECIFCEFVRLIVNKNSIWFYWNSLFDPWIEFNCDVYLAVQDKQVIVSFKFNARIKLFDFMRSNMYNMRQKTEKKSFSCMLNFILLTLVYFCIDKLRLHIHIDRLPHLCSSERYGKRSFWAVYVAPQTHSNARYLYRSILLFNS